MKPEDQQSYLRWRLVLGQHGQSALGSSARLGRDDQARSSALDWLYNRVQTERGARGTSAQGGLGPSQLQVPHWLHQVRELFPQETIETVQGHALDRFGIRELITDPEVLKTLEPNVDLAATLLSFRSSLSPKVLEMARDTIRRVTQELQAKLKDEMRRGYVGPRHSNNTSGPRELANLNWQRTIRRNLPYWDSSSKRLGVRDLHFHARSQRRMTRRVILLVDQSASMAHAMIHSSVMASILCGLNHVDARLVAFDTSVVDLSHLCHDPVEVLMSVQLGGGTNIALAMQYAQGLIQDPKRTIVVLVSDFEEGGSFLSLLASVERMHESGVKLLGLAALDERARPSYSLDAAQELSARGMAVAALTPGKLGQWLTQQLS